MGAAVSNARSRDVEHLCAYAKNLGLAFQITDDLLDYSGDSRATGKDSRQDRGRTTFVEVCGIDGARKLADELLDAALGALDGLGRRADRHRAIAEWVRTRDR